MGQTKQPEIAIGDPLEEMKIDQKTDLEEFYTPQELAKLLKLQVTTIYKYVKDGKLPVYIFGKYQRFRKNDIEDFLLKCRVIYEPTEKSSAQILVDENKVDEINDSHNFKLTVTDDSSS